MHRVGIGAVGVALIIGVALIANNVMRPPPVIDQELVVGIAEQQGYVSPSAAEALRAQAARTQADLEELRRRHPDWAAEVNSAIRAFNESDLDGARAAFADIDRLISEQRAELSAEQARSKYAQATLLYPFEFSKSEPLLCDAADLARSDIWYWIECGRARMAIGSLEGAKAAFQAAQDLAEAGGDEHGLAAALVHAGDVRVAQGNLPAALAAYEEGLAIVRDLAARDPGNAGWARDLAVSLNNVGDVRVAQGAMPAALAAFEEGLAIRRDLAERDPGNAGWARDVWVSLWRMTQVDPDNAAAYWEEAVRRMEDMAARGILLSSDAQYLEAAQEALEALRP